MRFHRFLVLTTICAATISRADVRFSSLTFDDALKQASSSHKFVMVDFYTDWCHWCHVLDEKTYTDGAVAEYADAHYIALKVNAEKGAGVQLAKKYDVHGYPTIVFFDPSGEESFRVGGYEPPQQFLMSMRVAAMGSLQTLTARMQNHPDDAEAAFALAERYAASGDNGKAKEYYTTTVRLDANDALHLAERAALNLALEKFQAGDVNALESYLTSYPTTEATADVHKTLALTYVKSNDLENSRKHAEAIAGDHSDGGAFLNAYAWECAEMGVNLHTAQTYAHTAAGLAKNATDKASYLDTEAEVLYVLKQFADAASREKEALALLSTDTANDKLRANLRSQLKKFQDAAAQ